MRKNLKGFYIVLLVFILSVIGKYGSYLQSEDVFSTDFIQDFSDKETAFRVHKVLHKLSEPYKEVFSLRVFGEPSFSDISDLFGKSESWARVTYHRACKKIREELDDEDHL